MPIPQRPRFRGKIHYPPNPQGAAMPVAGARVRIWDQDANGKNELLIDTHTTSSGRFNVRASRPWQDRTRIPLPFGRSTTIPDPSDIPVFIIKIEDPSTGNEMQVPFVYINDSIELPMVVVWGPPAPTGSGGGLNLGSLVGTIGGIATSASKIMDINSTAVSLVDAPEKVWELVKDDVEAGKKVTVKFSDMFAGPAFALPFKGSKLDYAEIRERVCDLLHIDKTSSVLTINPDPATLAAIVVIIFILFVASPLAIASAIFLVILAITILLAVIYGFRVEVTKTDTASAGGTNSVPIPLSDLKVVLIPPA